MVSATYLNEAPPPQKHETGPSPAGRFSLVASASRTVHPRSEAGPWTGFPLSPQPPGVHPSGTMC